MFHKIKILLFIGCLQLVSSVQAQEQSVATPEEGLVSLEEASQLDEAEIDRKLDLLEARIQRERALYKVGRPASLLERINAFVYQHKVKIAIGSVVLVTVVALLYFGVPTLPKFGSNVSNPANEDVSTGGVPPQHSAVMPSIPQSSAAVEVPVSPVVREVVESAPVESAPEVERTSELASHSSVSAEAVQVSTKDASRLALIPWQAPISWAPSSGQALLPEVEQTIELASDSSVPVETAQVSTQDPRSLALIPWQAPISWAPAQERAAPVAAKIPTKVADSLQKNCFGGTLLSALFRSKPMDSQAPVEIPLVLRAPRFNIPQVPGLSGIVRPQVVVPPISVPTFSRGFGLRSIGPSAQMRAMSTMSHLARSGLSVLKRL